MEKEEYSVPNLEKGLAVLECVSRNPEGVRMAELKKVLGISQTTLYRILTTLVMQGYLSYRNESRKYYMTRKMLSVGFQALREGNLIDIVIPRMKELRDIIHEPVFFGVMGVDKVVFIEQVSSLHPFAFTIAPGHKMHLHTSAPGKAIMAHLKASTFVQYLEKMEFTRYNENTIADKESYIKELANVRACGYAVDNEEELRGVVCIAAPLFNYNGNVCGTIWTSSPKDRVDGDTFERYATQMVRIAKLISQDLGYIEK